MSFLPAEDDRWERARVERALKEGKDGVGGNQRTYERRVTSAAAT